MSRYDKNYYECYARLCLIELLDERYGDLVHHDSPDLQGRQLSIGVEVTRSVSANEALNLTMIEDMEVQEAQLHHSVVRKLERLNKIYKLFQSNRLFIFAETTILGEENVLNVIKQAYDVSTDLAVKYDIIYVDGIHTLFICNPNSLTIESFEISQQLRRKLWEKSKKMQKTDW